LDFGKEKHWVKEKEKEKEKLKEIVMDLSKVKD